MKGDSSMNLFKEGLNWRLMVLAMTAVLMLPAASMAQDYKIFTSEEYGFTMKYPPTWVKIDRPAGNYYAAFQSPEQTANFRNVIRVSAHKPVKDPLNVFLQELRNGIADLQKQSGAKKEQQEVRILDEGEFKCEVPGAYYFFIQAFENNIKTWMDIVIVFYKHDQTLLRISCLAPSSVMERFQPIFNDVLTSVKFVSEAAPPTGPGRLTPPSGVTPAPVPPEMRPPTREPRPGVESREPSGQLQTVPPPSPGQPPASAPRSGPRGPLREPEKPATGIVN